ncbi:hypothetical protein BGW42_001038 [Actinomortierella wolfii]|nr:hypothetical protein BGW42_001038 [Actinomortierella wolfii]
MSMVITGGLETSYDQCTPRSPSIASSINTTRSVRMRDHARIFPKRLRTSTGSLREAYAGRHTPVLNSGCSGGWASPAMSIHSGRAGLPSAPIPGSGPSTPRMPVSRGEAGYMGKQTYIAFNKSAPRTVSTGHIASFTSTISNLSRHSSQNDIQLSGRGSITGGTQGFGSMDSMPSSPRSPSVYRAHSSGFRHNDIESMHPSGCANNNVNGPVLPMTREAAEMEENRLDQELRALRRRSMCNDIYRSQSVGCLSTGTKGTSCQSFDASVPDYGNPSESKHSKKRLMSSPSIRSLRSFMSPIIGGGQFTSNSNENGNCNVGKHSNQSYSGPVGNLGSPNLSSGLSTSNSLYQQQSYSQAHNRGERKSGFRSVFSTPNLTSIRARRASLRVKSTLSSLAVSSISSSSGTTTSPTSSTVSDLFLSPPPVLPLVEGQDQTESALDVPSNTAVMSADELIQTELAAIEMEKFEREQATAAATAAAVASAASPVETTMEEVQPQDGLLDPMGSQPPDGRSRASSVMSTDTDASSAASSVTSSTPSGKHPLSRPSIPPHPPHLQHHLPYQSQSPPQHPSMQRQLGQRGRGDDITSISSVRSKRSIPFGQLKKMLTKPFSFSNPLKDHHRSSSSSSSSITTSTITAGLPSISSSSPSTMHTQHTQHDDNRPVRFPTKDDGKFQWDYRRHVNPLHDDS